MIQQYTRSHPRCKALPLTWVYEKVVGSEEVEPLSTFLLKLYNEAASLSGCLS